MTLCLFGHIMLLFNGSTYKERIKTMLKIKSDIFNSFIDEEKLQVRLFGITVDFTEEQFFIIKWLYNLYDEEYKKNKEGGQ